MSRASIDYMNARRNAKPASGGANYARRQRVEYSPDSEADTMDTARNIIGAFSLWAETTRQTLSYRLAIPQADVADEIPF